MYCIMRKGRNKDREVKWFGDIHKARDFMASRKRPERFYLHIEYPNVDLQQYTYRAPKEPQKSMLCSLTELLFGHAEVRPDAGKVVIERPRVHSSTRERVKLLGISPRSLGAC